MDPLHVLHTFGDLLARGDADGAAALFAEDAIYEEPPRPMLKGRAAIRAFIADFAARHTAARFTLGRALVDPPGGRGGRVAAEWRWAYTRTADGAGRLYEGISIVEFRDGLIARWRGFSALVG